ncbi:MAG TPA: GAF domain-containing sensor histidine kinase [Gemmatimonadaceae bacterium]|nr:GAF domain-containing sensor histidine kinase [Gemmatimonadaceae bacterium]
MTTSERLNASAHVDPGIRELIAVREIVHAFLTADRPEDVFQFALERVSPLVGASFACVYLIDGASELMRLGAVHNWPAQFSPFLGEMRVRLGFGPSGEAASERRTIEIPDVFADASLEDWQEVAAELGFRSLVALPLQTGQAVLGAVTFYFADAHALTPDTRSLIRMVADQMAATAEKARLIEELRRANGALVESNSELERQYVALLEARRIKDEFLSNISHELRTPLTAVIGYISLMQDGLAGPINDEQQKTLGQVKTASEQLLGLIGDLLELTTLKRGGLEVVVSGFDPQEPLQMAIANTPGRAQSLQLRIIESRRGESGDGEHTPPARVMWSDRKKITKILGSLLSNAYKFTHGGEVRIELEVLEDRVIYSVQDTGIGIQPEAQRYVFDEFRQVDGSLTRRYGGSGLGLALARRLARLLGGDIVLVSTPSVGSTFRVEIPLAYEPREEPTTDLHSAI